MPCHPRRHSWLEVEAADGHGHSPSPARHGQQSPVGGRHSAPPPTNKRNTAQVSCRKGSETSNRPRVGPTTLAAGVGEIAAAPFKASSVLRARSPDLTEEQSTWRCSLDCVKPLAGSQFRVSDPELRPELSVSVRTSLIYALAVARRRIDMYVRYRVWGDRQ